MRKSDLVKNVAHTANLSNAEAEAAVSEFVLQITNALNRGDDVRIANFGSFEVRHRAAREGRDPRTGNSIQISASKGIGFKPAKALRSNTSSKPQ